MKRPDPSPLDVVLTIAATAGTEDARELVGYVRERIIDGDDPAPWANGVLLARDAGALAHAPACYLLDAITEGAVGNVTGTDPELVALGDQLEAIRRAHGLRDDEDYLVHEAPPDWRAVNERWDRRFDQLRAALLDRLGDPALARMCRLHPDEFDDLSREGWAALMPEIEDGD